MITRPGRIFTEDVPLDGSEDDKRLRKLAKIERQKFLKNVGNPMKMQRGAMTGIVVKMPDG